MTEMNANDKRLQEIVEALYDENSDDEQKRLAEELLAIDPRNPHGLLALWELLDEQEAPKRLDLLQEGVSESENRFEENEPGSVDEDLDARCYATLLMNLGYMLYLDGRGEEALETAQKLVDFDDEGYFDLGRTLLYRCLLDTEDFEAVLGQLESDPIMTLAGQHARAIALFETEGKEPEAGEALRDLFAMDPDLPFYLLGIFETPEDDEAYDDPELEETLHVAGYFAEIWSASPERLTFLSTPTFIFGYLTERLDDPEEVELLEKAWRDAGFLERITEAKKRLEDMAQKGADADDLTQAALEQTFEILGFPL